MEKSIKAGSSSRVKFIGSPRFEGQKMRFHVHLVLQLKELQGGPKLKEGDPLMYQLRIACTDVEV